jgi:hypothetical protein
MSLELDNVFDILELCFTFAFVIISLASESSENIASFFVPASLDKPARGFWEEPDGTEWD